MRTLAEQARDKAVARVDHGTDPEWREAAREAVRSLAKIRKEFTTDALWKILDRSGFTTQDPRALGAIMIWAASEGLITKTRKTRKSKRVKCHARDLRVWRSLVREVSV